MSWKELPLSGAGNTACALPEEMTRYSSYTTVMTRERGDPTSQPTQRREVREREERVPPRAWESGRLYPMCPVSLASSAAQPPRLLSPPAEESLICTAEHPHPPCNPPPVRGRDFSWEESPPRHLGCQTGMGRVESCTLPPARRDAATSCLSPGLLFPAKQAACVARCLAWHVREQEESAPLPESPA